ncbi:M48 family metallopeptidase [Thermotoga caldifontis]|uniref:M48 family metallopeptidase n=1 Tax=Thermotoga caldifontis TaxID=1508419 RepID=UPI00059748E5|nr:M48 family metallopeptidase [Thermotoga caldifontis]
MFKTAFLILLIVNATWKTILEWLNILHTSKMKPEDLKTLRDKVSEEELGRAKSYLKERSILRIVSELVELALVLYLVTIGLPRLEKFFAQYRFQAYLFFGTVALILYLVRLPFRAYSIFVIESKYGFNTTTTKTFLKDQILTVLLYVVFGLILVPLLMWLLSYPVWWWQLSILAFGFITFFWFIQPVLIAPLFHKFTKFEDEKLAQKLKELFEKANTKVPNIYRVDASRRTKKQNAYVTGIGKSRRLVLYDTILGYPEDEILSIVAHELGHHVKKHVLKDIFLFSAFATIVFYLTNLVYAHILKTNLFSIEKPHTAFLYALLFVSSLTYFLMPIVNFLSRKMEYEADAYSAKLAGVAPLVRALKRLVKENLSNPNPLPLYKVWYYTHPAPEERIEKLLTKGR